MEKSALSGVIRVNQSSSLRSQKSVTNVLTIARVNPRRDSGLPAAAKSWTAKICGRAERSATPMRVKNSACASCRLMGAKRWRCAGMWARLCWGKRRLGCGEIGRGMVGRRHEAKAAILITIADAKWAKQTNCAQNGAAALSDSICLHIKLERLFMPMKTRELLTTSEPRYLTVSFVIPQKCWTHNSWA